MYERYVGATVDSSPFFILIFRVLCLHCPYTHYTHRRKLCRCFVVLHFLSVLDLGSKHPDLSPAYSCSEEYFVLYNKSACIHLPVYQPTIPSIPYRPSTPSISQNHHLTPPHTPEPPSRKTAPPPTSPKTHHHLHQPTNQTTLTKKKQKTKKMHAQSILAFLALALTALSAAIPAPNPGTSLPFLRDELPPPFPSSTPYLDRLCKFLGGGGGGLTLGWFCSSRCGAEERGQGRRRGHYADWGWVLERRGGAWEG